MNTLRAGFARVNITPPMGIFVEGYYKERYADGVLDDWRSMLWPLHAVTAKRFC